jgi:outer membrane protein TolC
MKQKKFHFAWLLIAGISMAYAGDEILPFDKLIPEAMGKNPAVIRAAAEIRLTELDTRDFYFDYIPLLNVSLNSNSMMQGARKVQLGGDTFLQEAKGYQNHSMAVSLAYYLVQWGQKRRKIEIQELLEMKSRYEYISTYRLQLQQFIKELLTLESLRFQSDLSKREITDMNHQFEAVEKKIASGSLSEAEGWKIAAEMNSERTRLEQLNQELLSKFRALEIHYGLDIQKFDIPLEKSTGYSVEISKESIHPAIETVRQNIAIAAKEMEEIRRNKLPEISVSMGYYRSGTELADIWTTWNENWNASASLNLSLSLSEFFRSKTKLEKKQVQVRQLEQDIHQHFLEWNQWREELSRNLEQTQKDMRIIQENQKLYQQICEYESKRYAQGLITFENYMEIRNRKSQLELDLHQSYQKNIELLYEYRISMGAYDPEKHIKAS